MNSATEFLIEAQEQEEAMKATARTYTDTETGFICRLYTSNDSSKFHLIYEGNRAENAPTDGTEVNGFYIAAHTGATIKLNTGKKIFVDSGNFYHLKGGEQATHRKFVGFKTFTKI